MCDQTARLCAAGDSTGEVGPDRLAPHPDWSDKLAAAIRQLPERIGAVAVAYADWRRAAHLSLSRCSTRQFALAAVPCSSIRGRKCRRAFGPVDHRGMRALHRSGPRHRIDGGYRRLADGRRAAAFAARRPRLSGRARAACDTDRAGRLSAERVRELAKIVHGLPAEADSARRTTFSGSTRA